MNDKENVHTGGLSEDQKARISEKFRAAKALLVRKRPREITNSSSDQFVQKNGIANRMESPAEVTGIKRLPLSEISTNTPSLVSTKRFNLLSNDPKSCLTSKSLCVNTRMDSLSSSTLIVTTECGIASNSFETPVTKLEYNGNSYSDGNSGTTAESVHGSLIEREKSVLREDGFALNSIVTPLRQLDCSSSSDSLRLSGVLDDDFDQSIFKDIDALCEQTSAGKSRRENLIPDFRMQNQSVEESSGELSSVDLSDHQEVGERGSWNSEATPIGDMPDEHAKYMQSLNDRQREAACTDISMPLMIVAGPGSGKTSTMVGRILMLLSKGIGPSHVLAMTFTTAAASEMRERIGSVAGKAVAKELTVSTFHSFSLQICRTHAEKLDRTPEFLIYGHGQQRRAIIEAMRILENGKEGQNPDSCKLGKESNSINSPQHFKDKSKKWLKFVTQAKAAGRTPEDCHKMGDVIGASILQNYDDILKSCNALDYHDLISCSVKLLTDFSEVFKECQESWKAIVIDEFQDTSAMQYGLLQLLASHKRLTIVGDEDQSIFSFNGADVSGFESFRKDFPVHKEIRLNKNYRSTRCIVEAASALIKNNLKRCQSKNVLTDNSCGSKIAIKECSNEDAQCAFVVDKILEITSDGSTGKCSFGNIAVLYRRQVSGKVFQTAFRNRKIPFNNHGVAFYRKKVVRAIIALLRTTLAGCDDGSFRQVFKAFLPFEKEEKKKVIEHIDKISTVRKCSFLLAACDIFNAKISGTFKRSQLTQGRRVLLTLDMISKLVHREQSISAVITSAANMIPQKCLLEKQAVLDVDGGKLLNEDNDVRSVLQYLLDDVSEFLTTHYITVQGKGDMLAEDKGCTNVLEAFIDYISGRERENFRSRRHDNEDSVTLTTIHQSKGLEWDCVFIVKANESEIPLLHEFNGVAQENGTSVEEERRLLYVAMTRARKKLFILYVIMDSNWQVLQPSRFIREIPDHLQEVQGDLNLRSLQTNHQQPQKTTSESNAGLPREMESSEVNVVLNDSINIDDASKVSVEGIEACNGNSFLRRFRTEDRAVVSHLFHQWAKKAAFQDPNRLLDKVAFVIDERMRGRKCTHKEVLRALKSDLRCDEAFHYAEYVIKWVQIPSDRRAYLMREKQEHFQKLRIENAMGSSAATSKQVINIRSLILFRISQVPLYGEDSFMVWFKELSINLWQF
ncbi:unnamed protein product [Ilex paraguariensis]|uniref:DNA 3'-5' helicase n=1 Tax=Ilex paraguariensis TaxID=185542 RepID=A0ABC8QU79_9AQUA